MCVRVLLVNILAIDADYHFLVIAIGMLMPIARLLVLALTYCWHLVDTFLA